MTESPWLDELGDLALDVGLGADVDAAGRLVEDDQLGSGGQPAGEQHLLLVAAGEVADERRSGRPGARRARRCTRRPRRRAPPAAACACQPRRAWMPSTMFSPTVRSATMPSARRSSDENAIRCPIACRGERDPRGLAVDLDRARRRPGRRRRAAGRARCARSRGARRSRRPRRRRRRGRRAPARRAGPTPVARRTGAAERSMLRSAISRDGLELDELAPDHLGHQVAAGEVLGAVLADELAVAEHRDPVGDLVDLLEEVADEQDGDALVAQVADHREQPVDLVAVEARGRLVEDQHPGVEDHRPADRDQLLHRDRVAGQQRVGVEPEAQALQVPGRLAVGGLPVDAASGCAARGRASRSRRPRGSCRG